ncbi:MAG: 4Fe-4S cluster-binding domain-containing protein [Deltaproteobacteria bacterium]|nr:4Fe-4S cluster-binding domain-containing protein [Deltaproteobacteria bacterium]MBW2071194.1 4Fe-4S cluster-binding domain-containing protein [Deltaproteobacteria bacterium]
MEPAYLQSYQSGVLAERIEAALSILECCCLCPRRCEVNRLAGNTGVCQTDRQAVVSSYSPHFGEEDPLVGSGGSGTIFLAYCNLQCVFCQNYEISHLGEGSPVTSAQLADMMISLQKRGCHNINFVTPTHVVPQILEALPGAIDKGLRLPLVYNCSGYEEVDTLKLLDGVFDIYMPDFKFWQPDVAEKFCAAPDYPEKARAAVKEMHSQVGDLLIDEQGIACRGLLIRHLVMPEGLAGTRDIMRFLAKEISTNTYVNIMAQYRPCGEAHRFRELSRALTSDEYRDAVRIAHEEGIHRLDERRLVRLFHWL